MPYFKWTGINLAGLTCKGTTFARCSDSLCATLARRQIAVINYKSVSQFLFFSTITYADKVAFFEQLYTLLDAGIMVPDALNIIVDALESAKLQEIIHTVSVYVADGQPLSEALGMHLNIFDPIIIQIVKAGEESGNLMLAMKSICSYMRSRQDFRQKLRNALALPLITLTFFIGVGFLIFFIILPRFANLFSTMNKALPPITKKLLAISGFLNSRLAPIVFGGCGMLLVLIYFVVRHPRFSMARDRVILFAPFVGDCVRYQLLMHFFNAFGLLLDGGCKVVPALLTIQATIKNEYFHSLVNQVSDDVVAGDSVSASLSRYDLFFDTDMIAMVHIGQESGRLPSMLFHCAQVGKQRLAQRLHWITTFIQPCIMAIMGLCVTALIIAIYIPICSLVDISM